MFTVIYDKKSGRVLRVSTNDNAENLRKAIPDSEDFIFVEKLLPIKDGRQDAFVENGKLVVRDRKFTEEEKKLLIEHELNELRRIRQSEFLLLNKAPYWYEELTEEQDKELRAWRKEWLDVTDKYQDGIDIETIIPHAPEWLIQKEKNKKEETPQATADNEVLESEHIQKSSFEATQEVKNSVADESSNEEEIVVENKTDEKVVEAETMEVRAALENKE